MKRRSATILLMLALAHPALGGCDVGDEAPTVCESAEHDADRAACSCEGKHSEHEVSWKSRIAAVVIPLAVEAVHRAVDRLLEEDDPAR